MELITLLGGAQAAGSKISTKTLLRTQSYLKVKGALKPSFPDLRCIELTGNNRIPKIFLGSKC